jgi:antitoxin (DNA-binding transcriptional repressor) of toxin-antitoxin stability system
MQSLNVSEFREQLLSLIDHLPPEGVLVTKRGKPVAQLLPVRKPGGSLIGALKGRFEIRGDVFSTGEAWDAEH